MERRSDVEDCNEEMVRYNLELVVEDDEGWRSWNAVVVRITAVVVIRWVMSFIVNRRSSAEKIFKMINCVLEAAGNRARGRDIDSQNRRKRSKKDSSQ